MAREQGALVGYSGRRGLHRELRRATAVASLWLTAWTSWAQDRPSEAELFGAPAPAPPPLPEDGVAQVAADGDAPLVNGPSLPPARSAANPFALEAARDARVLGLSGAPTLGEELAPDDPLTIGGQLYWRNQTTGLEGTSIGDYTFNSPSLLDVYLDARPNDRVRAFVLTRIAVDPTLPATSSGSLAVAAPSATGGVSGSQSLSALTATQSRQPRLVLDQLWLRFDLAHTVFVTAGAQHVRWGTARFWTPADFLHLRRRNPLDIFDARTGTTMLKLHVPIESQAWNFYAYALTESPDATGSLGQVSGAARAEVVVGAAELGLGALLQRGRSARLAADLSFGLGDVDFYSELALRDRAEIDRVHFAPDAPLPDLMTGDATADSTAAALAQTIDALYPVYRKRGFRPQVVAGATYSAKYNDNDTVTLGGEYFYNALGYGSAYPYPGLVLPHSTPLSEPATFFYLGKVYGAVFATLPAPGSLDNHTFTLSTLGNFSDSSYVTRFDYSLTLLTHLRLEAFASARYGASSGEFRFGVKDLRIGDFVFSRAPALLDLGLAARVAL